MKKVINQEIMKETNKKNILNFIRKHAPVSKKEIAEQLGLSLTSVTTFTRQLIKEERIIPCGTAKSTGGRRSLLYRVNPTAFYVLGIDLQVDRIISVVLDFGGRPVQTREIPLKSRSEWQVIPLINQVIREAGEGRLRISGVGIGVPGIVETGTGRIEFAPNLGWKNVNLGQLLEFKNPLVIENEANAAALGEKTFGAGQNASHLVYVSVGMGVGCGLLMNGRLFSGCSNYAGEFGHVTVEPDGLLCPCGNRGCWEVYTSNKAALRLYQEKTGREAGTFEDFLALVFSNDQAALEVLDTIVKYLGIGIAGIINGINPEVVIVGGKIAETKSLIYNKLLQQVKERSLDRAFSQMRLEFSPLKNMATALGAAGMVIEKILNEQNYVQEKESTK